MGTFGQNWLPFSSGSTDTGKVSTNMLGAPLQKLAETYILVQCATGTDIASASNGKLLTSTNTGIGSVTAGPSYKVVLTTGLDEPFCVGMIPSSITNAISGGSYFLALRDSGAHVGQWISAVTGGATGGIAAGTLLKTTTGAILAPVFTAATTTTASMDQVISALRSAAVALETTTGVAAISGMLAFHAPFRSAG